MENSVIISHRKDADGIAAAALLRQATGGRVFLVDYGEMLDVIARIELADEVYISDLGLNKTMFDKFLVELKRLKQRGIVHYIDHHPIDPESATKLGDAGIDLFHSTEESAAMLVYKKFQSKLENLVNMKILACCGAITDYMDERPFARRLISTFDRQFLLYESTVLSFSIAVIGRKGVEGVPALIQIVEDLSDRGKLPHQIENSSTYAVDFASQSAALIERVKKEGKKMKHFAYFRTPETSTGNVANFLIGAFDVRVGVAFREEEPGFLEISLRGSEECDKDLGKIMSEVATRLKTSGGGHPRAAGARIKEEQFEEFLQFLDFKLSE